jgi:hypothetical protein
MSLKNGVVAPVTTLKGDIEDFLIYDFLENGTTWDQVKTALLEIANGEDPRRGVDRIFDEL